MKNINQYLVAPFVIPIGFYVYAFYEEDLCVPFYIGKGSNKRAIMHFYRLYIQCPAHDKIKSLIKDGYKIEIQIIEDDLSESQSANLEKKLIQKFGRKDLNLGPLLNLTDGGDGSAGITPTLESRRLMSIARQRTVLPYRKPINKLLNGFIIKQYEYMDQVKEDGHFPSAVCQVVKGRRGTHHGFNWEYA